MAAKTEAVKGRNAILAAVLALAVLSVAWLIWRAVERRTAVQPGIPAQPDLASWAPELPARLTAAVKQARGFVQPAAGLAELSRLYQANGFFDEASHCYDVLQQIQPTDARWPHLQASILASNGRLEEALPLYRRATTLAPDYLPARLRLGDVLLKANQTAEAAKVYGSILESNATEPYARLGLARCAIAGGDWSKARDNLQRCIAANPDFVGALSLLATVEEHFGDVAAANAIRERVNKREFVDLEDPWVDELMEDCYDPYRLSVAAAVEIFRGDTNRADRWLRRAILLSAQPAPYYRQLAKLQMGLKDYPAARRSFEQATALAPTDADAWALLVNLLLLMGDRSAAYRAVAAGLTHCPDSRALHYAHGRMLNEDGKYVQAIGELQEAKRLQPSEANAYVELAIIHFRLGEIEAGMAEMRDALVVQPDQPVALVVLGRDAIENGDLAAAREWIRRARLQSRVRPEDLQQLVGEFQKKFNQMP